MFSHSWSGLVRARGLKLDLIAILFRIPVRARKSPWIETKDPVKMSALRDVRARKSPWIETLSLAYTLKRNAVRARKSPWIETKKEWQGRRIS